MIVNNIEDLLLLISCMALMGGALFLPSQIKNVLMMMMLWSPKLIHKMFIRK